MPSKHEHIAGSLIQDILSGRYRVKDRLPSERDLAARNRTVIRDIDIPDVPASVDDTFAVRLDQPDGCPRYLGRVVKGIDPTASTPSQAVRNHRPIGRRDRHVCVGDIIRIPPKNGPEMDRKNKPFSSLLLIADCHKPVAQTSTFLG